MTAMELEEDAHHLHELRVDEWSDLALAILAMGCTLAATLVHPPFVLPLFIGSAAGLVLAGRAFFERLDLVDRLLLESDAYAIPEIRRQADKMASMESRRDLAASARRLSTPAPGHPENRRIVSVHADLEALANDLENDELTLDPMCAARCKQLLSDHTRSPLLSCALQVTDAGSWIRRIRWGFEPRSPGQIC